MGSVHPVRRFDALRGFVRRVSREAEAPRGPPLRACPPLQRHVPAAPHRGVAAPTRRSGDRSRDADSPGLWCPTTPAGAVDPLGVATDPSVAACHVRGLGTSFAACTTVLPAHEAPERPWASPFKAFPSRASGCPSRGPCPPDVAGRPPPRGEAERDGRLQGLVPAASPYRHRVPEGTRPSMPSWASPLQSFPPNRPGHRLWSRRRPPRPWAGVRGSPPGPRGFADRLGRPGPFPDCRLSWGFAPCDRHGAPFAGPGSGLMASPHAGGRAPGRAGPTAIRAPSGATRPGVHGPRPGAVVHRCSTGCLSASLRNPSGRE
jgi:hypothetical protein